MNTTNITLNSNPNRRKKDRSRRTNKRNNNNNNQYSNRTRNNAQKRNKEDSTTKLARQNKERRCEHGIVTRHFELFTNYKFTYSDLLSCKIDVSPRYDDGHAIYMEFAFSRFCDDIDIIVRFNDFVTALSKDYPLFSKIAKFITRIRKVQLIDHLIECGWSPMDIRMLDAKYY
eukprot:1009323_1